MCIIAYVPAGTQISREMMKINFANNPDGAGMMWKEGKGQKVMIKKGYKTVEDLMVDYYSLPEKFERAIHFRIATSGKICSATCHPFPVRRNVDDMRKDEDTTDMALMHNGIINFCTPKGGMSATFSDTMVFASKFLYPFRGMMNNKALHELIEQADSSRFLIFSKENEPILLGKWEEKDGIMYSNGTFKYEKRSYSCYDKDWWKTRTQKSPTLYDYDYSYTSTKYIDQDHKKTKTSKKYEAGKDIVMLFKMDVMDLDIKARALLVQSLYTKLIRLACIPKQDWKIVPEGIKIAVEYLPCNKGGKINGFEWEYGWEKLS